MQAIMMKCFLIAYFAIAFCDCLQLKNANAAVDNSINDVEYHPGNDETGNDAKAIVENMKPVTDESDDTGRTVNPGQFPMHRFHPNYYYQRRFSPYAPSYYYQNPAFFHPRFYSAQFPQYREFAMHHPMPLASHNYQRFPHFQPQHDSKHNLLLFKMFRPIILNIVEPKAENENPEDVEFFKQRKYMSY